MGWGVWSHHMFATGLGPLADSFFALTTMLIAIPTGVKIFNWLATIWGGKIILKSAMLFALGFIAMFTMGGLSGFMHASPPADLQQTDTYFVVAHIHYVLFGGAIMGIFAGIYYWFPKVTGRLLDERLGKIHFWSMMFAMNLTFFPMHFVGLLGMPRRVYTYAANMGFNEMNLMSTIGALLLAPALLVFIWNMLSSARGGKPAGNDPWGGPTLEWAIPSPPPPHNFGSIPHVGSLDPLWHKESREAALASNQVRGHIHMPPPSYWPMVSAFGITLMMSGMILGWWFGIPGLLITLVGLFSWAFEPCT
jgi:cytochrome c oxidase subunit 1